VIIKNRKKNVFFLYICLIFSIVVLPGYISCESSSRKINERPVNPVAGDIYDIATDIANKISCNFLARNENGTHYAAACTWHGTLWYAEFVDDSSMVEKSITLYTSYLNGRKRPKIGHVDYNVFGIWPFHLYQQTNDTSYLTIARNLADDGFNPPRSDGLCRYTRFWVDDLYMICSLQVQAYKALGEIKYMNRCGLQFEVYIDRLQQSNGLFHHTTDAPIFWGRGNGWVAAAMAEVLKTMPRVHPRRTIIMNAYLYMMTSLKEYQDSSGMWHQVMTIPSSYRETSCTGMFLFAMATGVRLGWLPGNEYLSVIEKGFRTLASYVNENGDVQEICVGTSENSNTKYYLTRPRRTGDLHGQAAVLWAAVSIMELYGQ
jgi:unsaturated rhamnogalacturonyl hydrolase